MNRIDFMNRLAALLSDLPRNERDEAVAYYNDYFNDAGVENEEEVLKALGSPEELARSIREGLKEDAAEQGEFSESGYADGMERPENEVAERKAAGSKEEQGGQADLENARSGGTDGGYGNGQSSGNPNGGYGDGQSSGDPNSHYSGNGQNGGPAGKNGGSRDRGSENSQRTDGHGDAAGGSGGNRDRAAGQDLNRRYRGKQKKSGMPGWAIALIVILCILLSPILLPVALTLGIVALVLVLVAAIVAGALLFSGIICIVAGFASFFRAIASLFVYPAGAILSIGSSLLAIGIGILLTLAIGWVLMKLFPGAFRAVVDFCSRIVHRKGGKQE